MIAVVASRVFAVAPSLSVMLLVAALSFRTAPVSLAKILLFVVSLGFVLSLRVRGADSWAVDGRRLKLAYTTFACLVALFVSMFWTSADAEAAVSAWVKSTKMFLPLLILLCLRDEREVKAAWWVFFAFQASVVVLSWWIVIAGRPLWLGPNNPANWPTNAPSPFTSYLDQALMSGITASMAWHLRNQLGPRWTRFFLIGLAIAGVSTCFLLPGRSGHIVALSLIGLTVLWALSPKLKFLALLAPAIVLCVVVAASPRTLERIELGVTEAKQFNVSGNVNSSIGERLHYWTTSTELIAARPLLGYGVGSWNKEYVRITTDRVAPAHSKGIRNPHQEFLLWGVQLGFVGVALLVAWFASIALDARQFDVATKRATWCAVAGAWMACMFNAAIFDALIGDYLVVVIGLCLALGIAQARASESTT